MPNHITNRLVIKGTKEEVNLVLEYIKGKGKQHFIDFNKIIPAPENMFQDDLSSEDIERCKKEGIPVWADWCPENWGTKWNSYNNQLNENTIEFQTAWNGVENVIDVLAAKFNNIDFIYQYASEDTGFCVGNIRYEKGFKFSEEIEGGTNRAYDICFELNPYSKEYYHMKNGLWQYNEDYE